MTRPVTLVVNPAARKGATLRMIDPVTDILRAHGWRVDVVVTRSADHASQVAADASVDDLLVTLGGDGLYGRVAAGAVVSGCLMAPSRGNAASTSDWPATAARRPPRSASAWRRSSSTG